MPAVFFGYSPGEITGTIVGDPDSLAGSKAHEEVQGVPTIDEMVVGLSGVEHDRSDDAGVLEELECSVDGGLRGAMASRLHFIEERIRLEDIIDLHDQIEYVGAFTCVLEILILEMAPKDGTQRHHDIEAAGDLD